MKPVLPIFPAHKIIEADAINFIDDYKKSGMSKDKRCLFELATEAVILSKKYKIESKTSVFDFRGPVYFYLWVMENENEECAIIRESYRSKRAMASVGGFLQAAEYGWFRKVVDRSEFKEKVTDLFPTILSKRDVTRFLKSRGVQLFGYDNYKEKVTIEYIPKGIIL